MRRFWLLGMLIMIWVTIVRAQADLPVVVWAAGDLWTWVPDGGQLAPLTRQGTVTSPAQSPDGRWIAYRVLAPVSQAALDRVQAQGAIADFDLPTDIYLVDPAAGIPIPVAEQPADAALFRAGAPDNALVRSAPVWSPDGNGLAWVEFAFGAASGVLRVFDRDSGQLSTRIASLPLAGGSAPELRWGRLAFAVRSEDAGGAQTIALYGVDGSPLAAVRPIVAPSAAFQMFDWIRWDDRDLLGLLTTDGRWQLFDPLAGAPFETDAVPALHPVGDPNSSAAIRFDLAPESGFFWEVIDPRSAAASAAYTGLPGQVALGPDGAAVVFIGYPEFGALALWRGGTFSVVAGTGVSDPAALIAAAVMWAPVEWRLNT